MHTHTHTQIPPNIQSYSNPSKHIHTYMRTHTLTHTYHTHTHTHTHIYTALLIIKMEMQISGAAACVWRTQEHISHNVYVWVKTQALLFQLIFPRFLKVTNSVTAHTQFSSSLAHCPSVARKSLHLSRAVMNQVCGSGCRLLMAN